MKDYLVHVPIAGFITVAVEAENENDAEDIALCVYWNCRITGDDNVNLEELQAYKKMLSGNVRHYPLNELEVQEN